MKLSAFVCTINPARWSFPYEEALRSYVNLFDEVVVIDSGSTDGSLEKMKAISDQIRIVHSEWPWEFKQREYPIHYNQGFDECSGDWVFKMDIDFIFHELDIPFIRKKLEEHNDNSNYWIATFQRFNIFNRGQFYDKGKMPTAVHKKFVGDRVRAGVPFHEDNTDWTILIEAKKYKDGVPYGTRVKSENTLHTGLPIYNYDCFFRTKEDCKVWFQRIARGFEREKTIPLYGRDDVSAWELWKAIRLKQKTTAALKSMKLGDHPMYIQEKIKNMTADQWGYNNWNWNL